MTSALLLLITASLLTQPEPSPLTVLVFEGPELHSSLVTQNIEEVDRLHVPRSLLGENPLVSMEANFVETVARAGSQGRPNSAGVRTALYALYRSEKELGFYGLEAETEADADRLEQDLRATWRVNASADRARVHRAGRVLLVIWTDGVSPECWASVNAVVEERLSAV